MSPMTPSPAATPATTEWPVTAPTRATAATALVEDTEPSQENGAASRRRQMDTARKARTTSGSNWVPAQAASSWRALSGATGFL